MVQKLFSVVVLAIAFTLMAQVKPLAPLATEQASALPPVVGGGGIGLPSSWCLVDNSIPFLVQEAPGIYDHMLVFGEVNINCRPQPAKLVFKVCIDEHATKKGPRINTACQPFDTNGKFVKKVEGAESKRLVCQAGAQYRVRYEGSAEWKSGTIHKEVFYGRWRRVWCSERENLGSK